MSQCGQYKQPRDKECRICVTVFNMSSCKVKHATTKAYHRHVTKNPEDHRGFKSGVKRLVTNVNEGGDSSLVALKNMAKTTKPLETVTEDACTPCLSQADSTLGAMAHAPIMD